MKWRTRMAIAGKQDVSSPSSKFDWELSRSFSWALLWTAVAIPLCASIVGAPLGILLFLWGIKPLRNYFTARANATVGATTMYTINYKRRNHVHP
jgi:hypothetical protein